MNRAAKLAEEECEIGAGIHARWNCRVKYISKYIYQEGENKVKTVRAPHFVAHIRGVDIGRFYCGPRAPERICGGLHPHIRGVVSCVPWPTGPEAQDFYGMSAGERFT